MTEKTVAKLEVQGLRLRRGTRDVLQDVSLALHAGEVVGVLGPNGCGKTTLLKSMLGLWRVDAGELRLDGEKASFACRRLRAMSGVVFQDPSLDNQLTARENLQLGGLLFGMSHGAVKRRTDELLSFVGLRERQHDRAAHFSGGMRRRLELARALIHDPALLFLDEPTTGLDPMTFDRVWRHLLDLRDAKQLAVLVSTHRADEAERMDRLLVMNAGRIVEAGTPAELLRKVAGDVIAIQADQAEELMPQLATMFKVLPRRVGEMIEIEHACGHVLIPRLVEAFPARRFNSIAMRRPSLSDVFYQLTGSSLDHDQLGVEHAV